MPTASRSTRKLPPENVREVRVGDYVVRPAYDGSCGARVQRKTGERYDDVTIVGTHCETDEGARALAALMNDAMRLAEHFHLISTVKPAGDHRPEDWVKHLIVRAVARAIDGPRPLPFGSAEAREYADDLFDFEKACSQPVQGK